MNVLQDWQLDILQKLHLMTIYDFDIHFECQI